eukprot:CAMPEP_0173169464 /NCGR_PEP_ID=MMETSP1141-20130122/721_1 /TAXON_ID=483371 /ORGANISM="non described non described, Strain CCMP2298" /LENGTH=107 /DNA_ID=CAMNT_0014091299 /DNA_START=151 /DNA_END=474 /DNA_ORIENTATION=+
MVHFLCLGVYEDQLLVLLPAAHVEYRDRVPGSPVPHHVHGGQGHQTRPEGQQGQLQHAGSPRRHLEYGEGGARQQEVLVQHGVHTETLSSALVRAQAHPQADGLLHT